MIVQKGAEHGAFFVPMIDMYSESQLVEDVACRSFI